MTTMAHEHVPHYATGQTCPYTHEASGLCVYVLGQEDSGNIVRQLWVRRSDANAKTWDEIVAALTAAADAHGLAFAQCDAHGCPTGARIASRYRRTAHLPMYPPGYTGAEAVDAWPVVTLHEDGVVIETLAA